MGRELTQKERMLAGRLYFAVKDPELAAERGACRLLCAEYNSTQAHEERRRTEILQKMLKSIDPKHPPLIEPPFDCDYGKNVILGKGVYMNFGCVLLDGNTIEIGDDTLLGPRVQFYPPGHPLDANVRDGLRGPEYAQAIKIGKNCWIGGAAIFIGGVTVGDCAIVGAGAVVTKDVPAWTVVAGNPARVVRQLQPGDKSHREIP